MTLDQLAIKYGSDKSSLFHNYCPFYEKYLPKNPKKILEIGVKEGASIRIWREYFPEAQVHGLDLFQEFPIPAIDGAIFHKGNQIDYRILEVLKKENFDLIVDDGSHGARHMLITFFSLYNGKHYFIEDLHCADEPFYQDELPAEMTAREILKSKSISNNNILVCSSTLQK